MLISIVETTSKIELKIYLFLAVKHDPREIMAGYSETRLNF